MRPDPHVATILVSCPDRRGLVAALAQLLYGHGANILDSDQHTDLDAGQFFQRIVFDTRELHVDRVGLENAIKEVAERFSMQFKVHYAAKRKRVAILVSRYDHCLYDLLLRQRSGELQCEIPIILSNHPELAPVAEQFGIQFQCLPVDPENRAAPEEALLNALRNASVDVVVLARYMQILSDRVATELDGRIINIHHSFLPAFVGSKPYHAAHERGVKLIGATAHYATAELDQGPIIAQDVAQTNHRDTVADLIRKGRDLERVVLAQAVRLHLQDRVLVYANRTDVFA